jgi:hypothetical protein
MGEDITVEIGGTYGEQLGFPNQEIRFVEMEKWPCNLGE